MATRFVIGRAGSGKSRYLHDRLVDHVAADPLRSAAVVLVPKQATFNTQRRIATDPRLGGFLNVRVIAPDDLAELALTETGEAVGAPLNASGRAMILSHLLRLHADAFTHFGRSAAQPGTAAAIDDAFGEFERAGRDLCDIDDLIAANDAAPTTAQQALIRKLQDLCKLYGLYQKHLTDHDFDPYRRTVSAPDAVRQCPLLRRAIVVVDDFYEFTAAERSLIVALAQTAPQTIIAMTFDPDSPIVTNPHYLPRELDVFHRTQSAYRKLHFALTRVGIKADAPELCRHTSSFKSGAIAAVERNLDARTFTAGVSDDQVRFVETPDAASEVEAAALQVKAWLREGYRLRDCCVFARTLDAYEPLLSGAFAEHGISFFVDRRREARHHPLVRTLTAVCQIVLTRWSPASVIELVRAGLTTIDATGADVLDDFLKQHNVPPALWHGDAAWPFERRLSDGEGGSERSLFTAADLRAVADARDALRAAVGAVGKPEWASTARPVRDLVRDFFDVMARLATRAKIEELIAEAVETHQVQDREEHEQVWARVSELADQLVDLLGEVEMTGSVFASTVQAQLAELELAIVPPTLDQVLVGTPDRTRVHTARAMIVLGLNAGQFPLTLTEKAVLNDRDRALLEANGVEVEPASQRAMLDERFLGYVALTRATEKLTLVRTRADAAGNELQPSPFWQLARHTLPGAPVEHPPEGVAAIATPRQAVTHLLHWARSATPMADVTAAALYHWVATKPTDAVRHVRDLAWPVLRHDNTPMLSAAVRKRLFPSPLAGSVSRLESFAACPFQHFVRYGLSLRQPPDPDITPADLGSLYHSVLEKLIQRVIDEEFDFASTDQLTPAQIGAVAQRVGEQLRNQLFLSSARNRYTLGRLEHIVARLLGAQQYACGRSAFKPGFTELQFGEGGDLPPLELDTPGGAKVRLSGKIDRVDLDDARQQYVVVDYKLRGEQLSLGYVAHGLMLQLLTYLMVLEINGEKLVGQKLTPAAAMYLKLLRTTTATKDPEAEPASTDPMFHGRSQARGIINAAYAEQLDRDIGDDTAPKLYSYRRTKKENKLYEAGNDGVELDEFQTLIAHVHGAIIELADGVIAGDIVPLPYMVGTDTPCGTCPYLSVCRFDRLINQYRILPRLSRREALDRIAGKGGFA